MFDTEPTRTDHQALTAARRAAAVAEQERIDRLIRAACTLGALMDEDRVGGITAWSDVYRNGASQLERV